MRASIILKGHAKNPDSKVHTCMISDGNGRIVALGTNKFTTPGSSIHAEVDCIGHMLKRFSKRDIKDRKKCGFALTVVRISGTGLKMSKPCSECMKCIEKYRGVISTIVWSTSDPVKCFDKLNL